MKMNIKYLLPAMLLLAAGCARELVEPEFNDDADGKVTVKVGMVISDARPLVTRAGILDGVPDRPASDYLKELKFYMFVFEDNGSPQSNYLRELVYGSDLGDPVISTDSHEYVYIDETGTERTEAKPLVTITARLDGTAENAIIHIVATADPDFEEQLREVPDRSEFGIFAGASGLYTSEREAYWKRIELGKAINSDNKSSIQTQLSHVNLVRNFCRVTLNANPVLVDDNSTFTPESFVIVNAIGKGYVTAYNENLGDDDEPGFVEFSDGSGAMRSYRYLADTEKYVPARHPASEGERVNADDNTGWTSEFEGSSDMTPKYMFERSVQSDHRTYVIVKGTFDGGATHKYIKLDIGTVDQSFTDANDEPYGVFQTFHLIRNFSYDITIKRILNKNLGHSSVESALGAPPANNISTSVETQSLTTITDGVDKMQIRIQDPENGKTYPSTVVVIVDKDEIDGYDAEGNPLTHLVPNPASVDLTWQYEDCYTPDGHPDHGFSSDKVKWNYPGYAFMFDGTGADPDGIIEKWDGNSKTGERTTPEHNADRNDARDYGDNWMGFKIYFNTPDDIVRQKTVRFYKPNGLTRDVTFISHKRWRFVTNDKYPSNIEVYPGAYSYEPESNPTMPFETLDEMREALSGYDDANETGAGYVGSQRNAQLTVMFELPDDLPEAIFPLDFKIGADRQNIENAYVGNAVATWGTSIFEDVGVMRMQFIKTVTWDYYCRHRIVCARFLTTTDVLADADDVYNNGNVVRDEDGNVKAITRIRVTNPYFEDGNDTFERSSHEDVIDPTRTRWHWNFSYPEWSVYFSTNSGGYADCPSDPTGWPDTKVENQETNPHNLNNLSFAGYSHGSKDDYTNVTGTFMQPKADYSGVTRSATNPEFQFDLAASSETGMKATMVIQATPNHDREYKGASYKYDRYYRNVYVMLITQKYPEGIQKVMNCDSPNGDKAAIGTRYRLELRTLTYTFDIDPGDVVEKVLIWSERREGDAASWPGTYTYKNGETRYYDILFTLTEN